MKHNDSRVVAECTTWRRVGGRGAVAGVVVLTARTFARLSGLQGCSCRNGAMAGTQRKWGDEAS